MTKPQDIKEPNYLAIWNKLQKLTYPCTIVVYGAEKTTITSHNRSEYESQFGIQWCNSPEEAWQSIDCGWIGYPPYLKVYAIPGAPGKPEEWGTDWASAEPIDIN